MTRFHVKKPATLVRAHQNGHMCFKTHNMKFKMAFSGSPAERDFSAGEQKYPVRKHGVLHGSHEKTIMVYHHFGHKSCIFLILKLGR